MLERIAKHHNLWLKMAKDMGVLAHNREDVVQDMYEKMFHIIEGGKDISTDDTIGFNKLYIWLTLKSIIGQMNRNKGKLTVYSTDDIIGDSDYTYTNALIYNETDLEEQVAFEKVYKRVMDVISNVSELDGYPKYLKNKVTYFGNLLVEYNSTEKSMRQISEETGIRLGTIHKTLNSVMELIRKEVGEDVQDYFNKDYHLL